MPAAGGVAARRGRRLSSSRAGFSLVEVTFAVVMLGTVLLGFAAFTRDFVRASNRATLKAAASDLAVQRLEMLKAYAYTGLDTVAGTVTNIPSAGARFTRVTAMRRVSTTAADYRVITVTVTSPTLNSAVTKSTSIPIF